MNRYFGQNLSADDLLAKSRQQKGAQPDSQMAETQPVVPMRDIKERRLIKPKEDPEIAEQYQTAPYELIPGYDDVGLTGKELEEYVHPPKFISDVPPDRPTMKSVYHKEEADAVESGTRMIEDEKTTPYTPNKAA